MGILLGLNVTDYIIITIVLASIIISLLRGLIKEVCSLIIWALGIWLACKFYADVELFFEPYITHTIWRQTLSFASIVIGVLIFGILFNYILSLLVSKSGLSITDRILGVVFGGARGVLLVAVILLMLSLTSFVKESWWEDSILIPYFQPAVTWLQGFIPEKIRGFADSLKI